MGDFRVISHPEDIFLPFEEAEALRAEGKLVIDAATGFYAYPPKPKVKERLTAWEWIKIIFCLILLVAMIVCIIAAVGYTVIEMMFSVTHFVVAVAAHDLPLDSAAEVAFFVIFAAAILFSVGHST